MHVNLFHIILLFVFFAIVDAGIIFYYHQLVKPLKDILLSAFLDKYQYKFINFLKEAVDEARSRNDRVYHRKVFSRKKDPVYAGAMSKLYADIQDDDEFERELKSITKLYGDKCIDDIFFFLMKSNSIHLYPDESSDDYQEKHMSNPYLTEDEISALYKENSPRNHSENAQNSSNLKKKQKPAVDISRLNTDNLDKRFKNIIKEYEDKTDIGDYL